MAQFNVDEATGDVTLSFNMKELVTYADCLNVEGGSPKLASVVYFASVIGSMVEKKDHTNSRKYLKMMGLKKFKIRSSRSNNLSAYARTTDEVKHMPFTLTNVTVTEDKEWDERP